MAEQVTSSKWGFSVGLGGDVTEFRLAILSKVETSPKASVVFVEAWNVSGTRVVQSVSGLHYSEVLQGMFAYLPEKDSAGLIVMPVMAFRETIQKVVISIYDWPSRGVANMENFGRIGVLYEQSLECGSGPITRVVLVAPKVACDGSTKK